MFDTIRHLQRCSEISSLNIVWQSRRQHGGTWVSTLASLKEGFWYDECGNFMSVFSTDSLVYSVNSKHVKYAKTSSYILKQTLAQDLKKGPSGFETCCIGSITAQSAICLSQPLKFKNFDKLFSPDTNFAINDQLFMPSIIVGQITHICFGQTEI